MKLRLKINGFLIVLALSLIVLFPKVFFRKAGNGSLDQMIEISGIVLILLGQLLRASARGFKSKYSRQGLTLVQGGPYSLVRNPMYLGILLIGLGIVLVLFEWWVAALFLLIFVVRYIQLIFQEERKLLEIFSEEYRRYMQRVPCILPPLKALFERDVSEYLPLRFAWVKREIGTVFAVLFIVLTIESWEDISKYGFPRYFIREFAMIGVIILLLTALTVYLDRRTAFNQQNGTEKS
ncbi:isoprenylcysteine carboxylmethyltransferase family protein [bacterium]|nr:MAG: isoprenylcysteine carboxylmethyltransferase family protein [bacterium]